MAIQITKFCKNGKDRQILYSGLSARQEYDVRALSNWAARKKKTDQKSYPITTIQTLTANDLHAQGSILTMMSLTQNKQKI